MSLQLTWWEKLALKEALSYTEHRSPAMQKFISEISSPALWVTLGAAVPLIAQLFTVTGNPHLAAAGAALVAFYATAVQLKDALLTVPPPAAGSTDATPALAQAAASLASASAAHAAAAAALPATVAAAKEAVTAVQSVGMDLASLAKAADAEFFKKKAPAVAPKPQAPAVASKPAAPAKA